MKIQNIDRINKIENIYNTEYKHNKGTGMNFYNLARKLNVSVEKLYSLYQELFPNVKHYSYTNMLLENELEKITVSVMKNKILRN
jgi:hypothetical protein